MKLDTFALHDHKMQRLFNFITKLSQNMGFNPQNYSWGNLFQTELEMFD